VRVGGQSFYHLVYHWVPTYSNWEHAPTYKTVEKLAHALGVPPSMLDPGFDD
jgi:hypothetical protein